MLMQGKEKIILNDHIQGDPLHENNLECVLNLVNKIRLLYANKSIWIYSGFTWNQIMHPVITNSFNSKRNKLINKRQEIIKQCDVLIDGRYIDSQRDISLKWRGSRNQNVIDIKKSLQESKIILYTN